jgi:3-phosphoshikimate 1-carboxyvinyltransferase
MAHVCITGNEQSPAALEQRIERVLGANPRVVCELRLDYLDLNPAAAFAFLARLPQSYAPRLVITNRLAISGSLAGGRCQWGILAWQSWWKDVIALRPWFICDLDWVVLDRLAQETLAWGPFSRRAKNLVFSLHDEVSELEVHGKALASQALDLGAGVKLAAPVRNLRDLERFIFLSEGLETELPMKVLVAMGEMGRFLRWSPAAGDITYFAVEAARATAAGQDTLADVLPYLKDKRRPDLYVLLGDNPENRRGEDRWNKVFLRRGARSRYVNFPVPSDHPESDLGARLEFVLRYAQVRGASITKPYKLVFGGATNTAAFLEGQKRREANTDGSAVLRLLREFGVAANSRVVVAGGGGAARSVEASLREEAYEVELWIRQTGKLGACPKGQVFISTWPGQFQEELVANLSGDFDLVVDAQFQRLEDSPLEAWAKAKKIPYVNGATWWREQARDQDRFWFGPERLDTCWASLDKLIPRSKSETIRALALAVATQKSAVIRSPGDSEDTRVFRSLCENLGFHIDTLPDQWRIYPPKQLMASNSNLAAGEGATGFRFLCYLASLFPAGHLWKIDMAKSLGNRPHEEVLRAFPGAKLEGAQLQLPTGLSLPNEVSRMESSQYASGWLIAALGRLYQEPNASEIRAKVSGERRSEPYWAMTKEMVEACGGVVQEKGGELVISLSRKLHQLEFSIPRDASSLAFLEVWLRVQGVASIFTGEKKQGDGIFPELCELLDQGKAISLQDNPDLAPPLWAYAALKRIPIEVVNCPQLRWKESNRAQALVRAAEKLGVAAEETETGFRADFSAFRWPEHTVYLATEGDHRLSMAFGLLHMAYPQISPDRKDCVSKSFPEFWQVMEQLEGFLPA